MLKSFWMLNAFICFWKIIQSLHWNLRFTYMHCRCDHVFSYLTHLTMQTFPWKQSNITDSSPFFSSILTHALSTYSRIWSWWSWINRSDIPALRLRFSRISSWSQGWVKSKMLCPVSSTYRERHAAAVFQNRWLSWNHSKDFYNVIHFWFQINASYLNFVFFK